MRRFLLIVGGIFLASLLFVFILALPDADPASAQSPQCPPGFFWQRLSGVGCMQENCMNIPNARYGYTGNCMCNEGFRTCSKPVDYTAFDSAACQPFCPAAVVIACVAPEASCPGEEPISPAEESLEQGAPTPISEGQDDSAAEGDLPDLIATREDLVNSLRDFLAGEGVAGPTPGQAAGAGAVLAALISAWMLVNLLSGANLQDLLDAVRIWKSGGDKAPGSQEEKTGLGTKPVDSQNKGDGHKTLEPSTKPPAEVPEKKKVPLQASGSRDSDTQIPEKAKLPEIPDIDISIDDKKKKAENEQAGDPEWSLRNRPSPDHRFDPETNSWKTTDELLERKREREGWVDDGKGTWTKPEIKIERLEDKALEIETEESAKKRISEIWAEMESRQKDHPVISIMGHDIFTVSDYASKFAKTIAAIDECKYQNRRLEKLDKLWEKAKEDLNLLHEALRKAETEGNEGMVEYLKGQQEIATDNLHRINAARDNAVERKKIAADRILVRGVSATYRMVGQATTDALIYGKTANTAGRLTGNIVEQAARGNLPGQGNVFRQSGGAQTSGSGVVDLREPPRLRLNSEDRLFDRPSVSSTTPTISGETTTSTPETTSAPQTSQAPAQGEGRLPTIQDMHPDDPMNPTGYAGRGHGGRMVIDDKNLDSLGRANSARPNEIKINSSKIEQVAQRYNANTSEFTWLAEEHEVVHLDKYMGRVPYIDKSGRLNVTLVEGEGGSSSHLIRLQLQDVNSKLITEKNVQWYMRQNWMAGKYADKVSQQTWSAWDHFNSVRLRNLERQRDELKALIRLLEETSQ